MLSKALNALCGCMSQMSLVTTRNPLITRTLLSPLLEPTSLSPTMTTGCQQLRFVKRGSERSAKRIPARTHSRRPHSFYQTHLVTGTEGGEFLSIQTSDVFDHLPTPETLKAMVNGIRYDELPILHLKVSKNNTLVTVTDAGQRRIMMYTSLRLEGFKNAQKKTTMAGQTTGVATGIRLIRRGIHTVRLVVRGVGPGRTSVIMGMHAAGLKIASISDFTNIIEIGKRPKRIRKGIHKSKDMM